MTTTTSTLTAFLLEQIAADEADNGCYGEGEYSTCYRRSEQIEKVCAAHRAILALHQPVLIYRDDDEDIHACGLCVNARTEETDIYPCPTLRHLASIYASRDGFDPAWVVT